MLSNFLIIPVVREKIKVKLALAIPTGAPTTLADEMIQTPLLVALKTIKILSMKSKAVTYLLNFLLQFFLFFTTFFFTFTNLLMKIMFNSDYFT